MDDLASNFGVLKDAKRPRSIRRNQFPQVLMRIEFSLRNQNPRKISRCSYWHLQHLLETPSALLNSPSDSGCPPCLSTRLLIGFFSLHYRFSYEPCSKLGNISSHFPVWGDGYPPIEMFICIIRIPIVGDHTPYSIQSGWQSVF